MMIPFAASLSRADLVNNPRQILPSTDCDRCSEKEPAADQGSASGVMESTVWIISLRVM